MARSWTRCRQPARETDSLDTAHNDAISADLQQITLVLGDLSVRGDADRRRQRVEVGGATKLDADGSNVVDRRACDLNRFELEPGAAGNVLAEMTNNRLQCSVCVLDTDAIPELATARCRRQCLGAQGSPNHGG